MLLTLKTIRAGGRSPHACARARQLVQTAAEGSTGATRSSMVVRQARVAGEVVEDVGDVFDDGRACGEERRSV